MKARSMFTKKVLPAALLVGAAAGLSSQANASAYAIAYNNVFDLLITSNAADGSCPDGSQVGDNCFYVPLDDFTSFTATSGPTSAQLDGLSDPGNLGGSDGPTGGTADAPLAFGAGSVFNGGDPTNNSMLPEGQVGTYAWSDAEVGSTALQQGSLTGPVTATGDLSQAWAISEVFVADDGGAVSISGNSSSTGINTTINLQESAIFNFQFNADPYLEAVLTSAAGIINANIDVTLSITSGGQNVFEWNPDGQAGNITGGTENDDPFSLSTSIQVSTGQDPALADATGDASLGDVTGNACGAACFFSASTVALGPGIYTISLNMVTNVDLLTEAIPVPAPGMLSLLGLGLLGLGVGHRRRVRS